MFNHIFPLLPPSLTWLAEHTVLCREIEGNVNILDGNWKRHCKKRFLKNMYTILNIYWDRDIWMSRLNSVSLCSEGFMKNDVYNKIHEYTRRTVHCHFGCCCSNKERENQLRPTKLESCIGVENLGALRQDFRQFILYCNKFVVSVQQIRLLNI